MSSQARNEATATPFYPIREVARLTGVTSVTLRAWERRYGLVQPQRTPKGHRLYSAEDIDQIQRILQWLEKGVPVSQVGDLIQSPALVLSPDQVEPGWNERLEALKVAIAEWDEAKLDHWFTQVLADFPGWMLVEKALLPLLQEKNLTPASGAWLSRYVRTRAGMRLYHRARQSGLQRLVLLNACHQKPAWSMQLALLSLSDLPFVVHWLDDPCAPKETQALLDGLNPHRLILVTDHPEPALPKNTAQIPAAVYAPLLKQGLGRSWPVLDRLDASALQTLGLTHR